MKFVPVQPKDFEDFKATRMEGMRPHVENEGLPWQGQYEEWYHRHMFEHGMKFGTLHKVIDDDNTLVGYIGISSTINIGIWLNSSSRNKGLGTEAINKVFTDHPHTRFELDVFKNSPARKLYEKLGFKKYAESDHFYYLE